MEKAWEAVHKQFNYACNQGGSLRERGCMNRQVWFLPHHWRLMLDVYQNILVEVRIWEFLPYTHCIDLQYYNRSEKKCVTNMLYVFMLST